MVRMGTKKGCRIIGFVGERSSGKTSLILHLLGKIQIKNLSIAGVISPGIFDGERKVAIELIDLISREGRLLARLTEEEPTEMQFGDWSFYKETLDWGNQRLKAVEASDLLILDEVGPLELDLNQGLLEGLARMQEGQYKVGIVTLRPRCAESIQRRFPNIELFYLEALDHAVIKETAFRIVVDSN